MSSARSDASHNLRRRVNSSVSLLLKGHKTSLSVKAMFFEPATAHLALFFCNVFDLKLPIVNPCRENSLVSEQGDAMLPGVCLNLVSVETS